MSGVPPCTQKHSCGPEVRKCVDEGWITDTHYFFWEDRPKSCAYVALDAASGNSILASNAIFSTVAVAATAALMDGTLGFNDIVNVGYAYAVSSELTEKRTQVEELEGAFADLLE